MARRALTLPTAFVGSVGAALACALSVAACGLDLNGLGDTSLDGSAMTSSAPGEDASVSVIDGSVGAAPFAEAGAAAPLYDATTTADATGPSGTPPPAADDASSADAGPVRILDPDASYPTDDPCDIDQDGYKSMQGSCGGNDCCDYDSRANPGDTAYYTSADSCGSFDYDCNGKDNLQYPKANCQLGFFSCNGNGFDQNPPACGASATYDTCDYFVACYTTQSTVTEGCR